MTAERNETSEKTVTGVRREGGSLTERRRRVRQAACLPSLQSPSGHYLYSAHGKGPTQYARHVGSDRGPDKTGQAVAWGTDAMTRPVDGRYVGFVPGRRGVCSEPALYAGLKERSQVK